MKLLLTGASGVVGKELIPFLLGKGHQITAISRSTVVHNHSKFHFLNLDLNLLNVENGTLIYPDRITMEKLDKILWGIEGIIHFSGVASGMANTRLDYFLGNTKSVATLVGVCKIYNIHNFIYSSSASVYGESGIGKEAKLNDPLLGSTHYAISKIKGEEILRNSEIGRVKILRIASVYGPGFKSFLNKLLILKQKGIMPLPLKVKNFKSLIYYKDLLELVEAVIHFESSGIFNLAHPENLDYYEIVSILERRFPGRFWKIPIPGFLYELEKKGIHLLRVEKDPKLKPLFDSVLMDTSDTISALNYTPQYSLERGLLDFNL